MALCAAATRSAVDGNRCSHDAPWPQVDVLSLPGVNGGLMYWPASIMRDDSSGLTRTCRIWTPLPTYAICGNGMSSLIFEGHVMLNGAGGRPLGSGPRVWDQFVGHLGARHVGARHAGAAVSTDSALIQQQAGGSPAQAHHAYFQL